VSCSVYSDEFSNRLYVGTDVGVYITLNLGQGSSSSGYQFILDGVDVSFFSATNDMLGANSSKQIEVLKLTGLSNTQHTLSFTPTIGSDSPPGLFFDYILYNTSTIPSGNATLFFDDASSQIHYDSNWHTVSTSSNPLSRTFMNNTHDANGSDADSTFTFPFSGTFMFLINLHLTLNLALLNQQEQAYPYTVKFPILTQLHLPPPHASASPSILSQLATLQSNLIRRTVNSQTHYSTNLLLEVSNKATIRWS
jgi:hypothetical protein